MTFLLNTRQAKITSRLGSACFVLILSPAVFAIEFGELEVINQTGAPFEARIAIFGAGSELIPDCFQIDAVNPQLPLPTGLTAALTKRALGPAYLKLRTNVALPSSAAGFAVEVVCPVFKRREYYLSTTAALPSQAISPSIADAPAVPDAQASSAQQTKPSAEHEPPQLSEESRARLTLTAQQTVPRTATRNAQLKLDTSLPDLSIDRPRLEPELTDEETATQRKIAHLEKELLELQKKHGLLVEQSQAALKIATKAEDSAAQYKKLAFVLGALLWTILLIGLLRNPSRRRAPEPDESQPSVQPTVKFQRQYLNTIQSGFANPPGSVGVTPPVGPASAEPAESASVEKQNDAIETVASPVKVAESPVPMASVQVENRNEPTVSQEHIELTIRMLERRVRNEKNQSPAPWLLLLDLLNRTDRQQQYEDIRTQCHNHFNIDIPAYRETPSEAELWGLESYPRIMTELIRLWPGPECHAYLNSLIRDNRGGNRIGFDMTSFRELILLRAIKEL